MSARAVVIDLFCGAGGLSEGFSQAGYEVLAGNDHNQIAGETFAATHRKAAFYPDPIEQIDAAELLRATGLKRGDLDCLAGGPPCQAFSVYNHQRGMHDSRSKLFREYLRIVDGLQPKWVVMENVTGIHSAGGGKAVKEILAGLGKLGYAVDMRTLHAERYGVPQERRRVFFVGNRLGLRFDWPPSTHGPKETFSLEDARMLWEDADGGLDSYVTVWDAIGDLPRLKNGQAPGPLPYASSPMNAYQAALRAGQTEVHNHAAPGLSPINLKRMPFIPQGGSWRDIPVRLLPAGMKLARRCDHTKRYGRLMPDGLACTILTKCDLHWGAFIHPYDDRVLTVREAARLQSFPDRFHFKGPRTEQYVQVGNAVPPVLARCLAGSILQAGSAANRNASKELVLA